MKKANVLIIGSGPAGMNAALYLSRMDIKTTIIEKGAPGGKLVNISKIENFLGDETVEGPNLALRMKGHIDKNGVQSIYGDVASIDTKNNFVTLSNGDEVSYNFLIIASGTSEKVPSNIVGIEKFNYRGVSYCAICDGPVYKGKPVAVIGGGNSAIEEAAYLSTIASEVHVFVRSEIKAEQKLIDDIKKDNITLHIGHEIKEIVGEDSIDRIETTDGEYKVNAIFPYIGLVPNTSFINDEIKSNNGFIVVDSDMRTNVKNVFAIGDVNDKRIRQITTALSDGTIAAKIIANEI